MRIIPLDVLSNSEESLVCASLHNFQSENYLFHHHNAICSQVNYRKASNLTLIINASAEELSCLSNNAADLLRESLVKLKKEGIFVGSFRPFSSLSRLSLLVKELGQLWERILECEESSNNQVAWAAGKYSTGRWSDARRGWSRPATWVIDHNV